MKSMFKKIIFLSVFGTIFNKLNAADSHINIWIDYITNEKISISRAAYLVRNDYLNPGQAELIANKIRNKLIQLNRYDLVNKLSKENSYLFKRCDPSIKECNDNQIIEPARKKRKIEENNVSEIILKKDELCENKEKDKKGKSISSLIEEENKFNKNSKIINDSSINEIFLFSSSPEKEMKKNNITVAFSSPISSCFIETNSRPQRIKKQTRRKLQFDDPIEEAEFSFNIDPNLTIVESLVSPEPYENDLFLRENDTHSTSEIHDIVGNLYEESKFYELIIRENKVDNKFSEQLISELIDYIDKNKIINKTQFLKMSIDVEEKIKHQKDLFQEELEQSTDTEKNNVISEGSQDAPEEDTNLAEDIALENLMKYGQAKDSFFIKEIYSKIKDFFNENYYLTEDQLNDIISKADKYSYDAFNQTISIDGNNTISSVPLDNSSLISESTYLNNDGVDRSNLSSDSPKSQESDIHIDLGVGSLLLSWDWIDKLNNELISSDNTLINNRFDITFYDVLIDELNEHFKKKKKIKYGEYYKLLTDIIIKTQDQDNYSQTDQAIVRNKRKCSKEVIEDYNDDQDIFKFMADKAYEAFDEEEELCMKLLNNDNTFNKCELSRSIILEIDIIIKTNMNLTDTQFKDILREKGWNSNCSHSSEIPVLSDFIDEPSGSLEPLKPLEHIELLDRLEPLESLEPLERIKLLESLERIKPFYSPMFGSSLMRELSTLHSSRP